MIRSVELVDPNEGYFVFVEILSTGRIRFVELCSSAGPESNVVGPKNKCLRRLNIFSANSRPVGDLVRVYFAGSHGNRGDRK